MTAHMLAISVSPVCVLAHTGFGGKPAASGLGLIMLVFLFPYLPLVIPGNGL